MRVISGTARGRKLREPSGTEIRPTSDMVKESVFDIIQFDIEGRHVLDLFAGTGQLGIEALSRGASSVVFVDSSAKAVDLVRCNIELCGFSAASIINKCDALDYLENCGAFDLIIIDPPYNTALNHMAIEKIIEFDKLNTNGIIICEMKADMPAPVVSPPYYLHREYIYGNVKVIRYEYCCIPRQL